MQVIAADPEITLTDGDDYTLKSSAGSDVITVGGDLKTLLVNQGMLDAAAAGGGKVQSTAYKAAEMDIELEYDSGKKVWNVKKAGGTVEVSGKLPSTT